MGNAGMESVGKTNRELKRVRLLVSFAHDSLSASRDILRDLDLIDSDIDRSIANSRSLLKKARSQVSNVLPVEPMVKKITKEPSE